MTERLQQKLFQDHRSLRYTLSSPEDLIPSLLRALEIALFPSESLDKNVLKAGHGSYPIIYTHYAVGFFGHVPCKEVPSWLDQCRKLGCGTTILVGFISREDIRRLPHMMNVLFPTRSSITKQIGKRTVEHILDCHEGEYWVQLDLCQSPFLHTDQFSV